jgi:hypothetical protein
MSPTITPRVHKVGANRTKKIQANRILHMDAGSGHSSLYHSQPICPAATEKAEIYVIVSQFRFQKLHSIACQVHVNFNHCRAGR